MYDNATIELISKKIADGTATPDEKLIAKEWLRLRRVSSFKEYCLYMIPTFPWQWFHFYIMDRIQTALDNGFGKIIIEMPPRHAKMLRNSDKIKTANGWTTHGEIKVGDIIDNASGKLTKVTGVYPQGKKELYRITFNDGRFCDAGLEHLWEIKSRCFNDKSRVINTAEIIRLMENPKNRKRLYIPRYVPIKNDVSIELSLNPYLLGVLLGDGTFRHQLSLSTPDGYIVGRCAEIIKDYGCSIRYKSNYDYSIINVKGDFIGSRGRNITRHASNKIKDIIKSMGLWDKYSHEKFIPKEFLNGSYEQRLELLKGLMDTDGTIGKSSSIQYTTSSYQLALDVQYLVRSLGGLANIKVKKESWFTYKGERKLGKESYRVNIRHSDQTILFSLPKKLVRCKAVHAYSNVGLRIESIEYIDEDFATCIAVEDEKHLYVTNDFIVTHNTLIAGELLSSYYFGRYPERKIIYGTYNNDRAKSFVNSNLIPCITSARYSNLFDSRIKWNDDELSRVEQKRNKATNLSFSNTKAERGAFMACGRGNAMTGEPGNLIIIDDPIKDFAEARSPTIRQGVYEWFSNVVETRLEDINLQLIFCTRWHSDDLIGRIKKINEQNIDPDFEPWEVITFPAIKEEIHKNNDYDKRRVGQYLVPDKKHIYATNKKDPRKWNALFQQRPLDEDGMLFQRSYINWYHTLPEGGAIWISVDPNKKITNRSDLVGLTVWLVKYMDSTRNQYFLLEFLEEKHNFNNLLRRIDLLVMKYRPMRGQSPNILIEVENGQALYEMCKEAHPNTFDFETKAASKFERAQIFMNEAASGNVFFPTQDVCPSIEAYISEWLQFTGERGGKDNNVDASSQLVVHHTRRMVYLPDGFLDRRPIANDYQRAFGKDTNNMIQPFLKGGNNGRPGFIR